MALYLKQGPALDLSDGLTQREWSFILLSSLLFAGLIFVLILAFGFVTNNENVGKLELTLRLAIVVVGITYLLVVIAPASDELDEFFRAKSPPADPFTTADAPGLAVYDIDRDGVADFVSLTEPDQQELVPIPLPEPSSRLPEIALIVGFFGSVIAALLAIFKGGVHPSELPAIIRLVIEEFRSARRGDSSGDGKDSSDDEVVTIEGTHGP